jgi:hypothetical protein
MTTTVNHAPAVTDYFGMYKLLSSGGESWMAFVEKHGSAHIPAARPSHIEKQPFGECFRNSIMFVQDNPGYTYVEGFAMMEVGVVTQHAWCIDEHDVVMDVTWENPEKCQYYGIPFFETYVLEVAWKTEVYGVLCHSNMALLDLDPKEFRED